MSARIVSRTDEWRRLEPQWRRLVEQCSNPAVTLTWPWLDTWWSTFGDETRELRVVLVERGGELVGAAPLLRRTRPIRRAGWLPLRRVELMASGEERGSPICSDYIGWPVLAGHEEEVATEVLSVLTGDMRRDWDEVLLPDMDDESPMVAAIRAAGRRCGLSVTTERREPCAVLTLERDWDAMLAVLPSGLRYKIRRGLKELESVGGRYEVISRPEHDWQGAFEHLVKLHQARWTGKGHPGAFKHPRRLQFHREVIPRLLADGQVRLGLLYGDSGEPIGAIYNPLFRGHVMFYQSGIRPAGSSHLRPGLLLHALEVQAAVARGDAEYDFLKRGHSAYKDNWTSRTRDLVRLRIGKRDARDHAYRLTMWALAQARRAKHAWESRGEGAAER